jgi:hypothetical protein
MEQLKNQAQARESGAKALAVIAGNGEQPDAALERPAEAVVA